MMIDENAIYAGILKSIEGSKWKASSQHAYMFPLDLVFDIVKDLENRTYISHIDKSFVISERGRSRYIDSFKVKDRAIRHVLCDNILEPLVRNKIIYDNGASVVGRGISHARRRLEVHLREYYNKFGTNKGYILLGDYSKYYDNILHDIAKEQFLDLVNHDEFIAWLLDIIFKGFELDMDNVTDEEYDELYYGVLNKLESHLAHNDNAERVLKKSISIGDQLSQLIGIYYPHDIDNYIKIVLGQKYYGRYMDDWYIVSDSREELADILEDITAKGKAVGLHVNLAKTHIARIDQVFKFLQIKYSLTDTGRIIKRVNPKRVTDMRRKIKALSKKVHNGELPYEYAEVMFRTWMGSFYKIISREQRRQIILLYEQCFNVDAYVRKGKLVIEYNAL